MQITETSTDGLKRTLKVVVGAEELDRRFASRLDEVKDRVQLKGFRKGKVPVAHIKKVFGRSLMTEVLQQAIDETSRKAIEERKERPAARPAIALSENQDEINQVIDGKADLAYSMSFEVLPEFKIVDFSTLNLERLTADVDDETLDKQMADLLARSTTFASEEGRTAETGDRVTIDYEGRIDGVAFDGGKGEALSLVLGNAGFIPGFEEGLIGAAAGDAMEIKATFPAEYPVADLAGKDAIFAVSVKSVEKPNEAKLDDDFATSLGAASVDDLKRLVSEQIKRDLDGSARIKLKRELLDALDAAHDFELPPSLVDREFGGIWQQLQQNLKSENKTLEQEGKSEDDLRAEYRKIAERRVRLGLVVGEIGSQNKIEVTQDELRRALIEQARRYQGQEKFVYEYFEKTPGALQELRAPIFEDKVVDFVLGAVKPLEKKVTPQELVDSVKQVTEG